MASTGNFLSPGGSQLLAAVTAGAADSAIFLLPRGAAGNWVFSADINGTGSVSATVTFQGSIDGVNWFTIGSAISLSGSNSASGSTTAQGVPWPQVRAAPTSITGTGAAIDAWAAAA